MVVSTNKVAIAASEAIIPIAQSDCHLSLQSNLRKCRNHSVLVTRDKSVTPVCSKIGGQRPHSFASRFHQRLKVFDLDQMVAVPGSMR
jgi:hypothetical protein